MTRTEFHRLANSNDNDLKGCDGGQRNAGVTCLPISKSLSALYGIKRKRFHHKHAKDRYSRKLKAIKGCPTEASCLMLMPAFAKHVKSSLLRQSIKLAVTMHISFDEIAVTIWSILLSDNSSYWLDLRHGKTALAYAATMGYKPNIEEIVRK